VHHEFKVLAAGLCVARLVRMVQRAGQDPEAVALAVSDIHGFFRRLEGELGEDLRAVFGADAN
jgi:hypothetical protein